MIGRNRNYIILGALNAVTELMSCGTILHDLTLLNIDMMTSRTCRIHKPCHIYGSIKYCSAIFFNESKHLLVGVVPS